MHEGRGRHSAVAGESRACGGAISRDRLPCNRPHSNATARETRSVRPARSLSTVAAAFAQSLRLLIAARLCLRPAWRTPPRLELSGARRQALSLLARMPSIWRWRTIWIMVIARYNLPIAQMDILRTAAGGSVRGVNTGVVSGTPGGAVWASWRRCGHWRGRHIERRGRRGRRCFRPGHVHSRHRHLGLQRTIRSINANTYVDHTCRNVAQPDALRRPGHSREHHLGNISYHQAFPTGGSLQVVWNNEPPDHQQRPQLLQSPS